MQLGALDHVGVAVASLDEALPIWEALLGATATGREQVAAQRVEVVFIGTGAARIELLAPTHPESPVSRFLERRGSGLHHLCYQVGNLRSALDACRRAGYQLIDPEPRAGAHGHQVAFLHPRSASGVLIELLERTRNDE
jgi:methylmalonyl-CoA/ethylmalonyl-CoA epimerase